MEIISRKEAKEQGLKRYFTGEPCVHGHVSERSLTNKCYECARINATKFRKNNKDKIKQTRDKYNEEHSEEIILKQRIYRTKNKEHINKLHNERRKKLKNVINEAARNRYTNNAKLYKDRTTLWRKNNKESVAEKDKIRNIKNRERNSIRSKAFLSKNRDTINAKRRENYKENRELILERHREWYKNNKHISDALSAKRRAVKSLSMVKTWDDKNKIIDFYKGRNLMNNNKGFVDMGIKFQGDHIIPITHDDVSGLHCHNNLQILTGSLNSSKSNSFVQSDHDDYNVPYCNAMLKRERELKLKENNIY